MTFVALIVHNLATRKLRVALTALAVALSVMTVITLAVVTDSLRTSATAILETGTASFTVAQRGASDVVNGVVTDEQVAAIGRIPGVRRIVGVLVNVVRLDAQNPLFLEIGVNPTLLEEFGATVIHGRPYGALAPHEIMLGWQAAADLGVHVGDSLVIDGTRETVVGIYSTGQTIGDTASMFPLVTLQGLVRKPGTVTVALVQVEPHTDIAALRSRIEREFPNLATVRLASEFGQVDRNLAFLTAAENGARLVAVVMGVLIVMNSMLLSFTERIREFGLLRSIGWTRLRVLRLVVGEALGISLLGGVVGAGLAVAFTVVLERVPSLRGVLDATFTPGIFITALYTAVVIGSLAALYPGLRAASLKPLAALRRE